MRISDWSSDVCSSDLSSSPTAAGDAGTASPVRSVDLSVGQLDVLDRAFSDTRVQLGLLDDGVQLHFDGAQIKGTLDVPSTLPALRGRSEEHTSELQSLMRISYAVFCLKKKKHAEPNTTTKINN